MKNRSKEIIIRYFSLNCKSENLFNLIKNVNSNYFLNGKYVKKFVSKKIIYNIDGMSNLQDFLKRGYEQILN